MKYAPLLQTGALAALFVHGLAEPTPPPWRDGLLSLHRSLVSIPSVTGAESAVGQFLMQWLRERNFTTQPQFLPSSSSRFNVLAWPGPGPTRPAGSRPRVLVTSHLDVVPPHIPYSISDPDPSADTRIGGRGSVDAKGSVAAQLTALVNLLDRGAVAPADLMVLYVIGEEVGGEGMRFFSGTDPPPPRFESVIFGEPTENKLACGHKGGLFCQLRASGVSGHSGYPWLGKSANELMIRGLGKVLDADLGSNDEWGNTTVNVGRLRGGVALNVIPDKARADLAIRVAIGPEKGGGDIIQRRVQDILDTVDEDAFTLECSHGYGFVQCRCDVDGFEGAVMNYGTDIANLGGDHTRYLYGPGSILVAHGDHENLTVSDLEAAVVGFEKLILHALNEPSPLESNPAEALQEPDL